MNEHHSIEVKTDTDNVADTELERLAYSALDTAWNLLNEYAVRVTLQELREESVKAGVTDFPSDAKLFADAIESGDPDAPTSYRDLYPGNLDDRLALSGLFASLLIAAAEAVGQSAEDIAFEDIVKGFSK